VREGWWLVVGGYFLVFVSAGFFGTVGASRGVDGPGIAFILLVEPVDFLLLREGFHRGSWWLVVGVGWVIRRPIGGGFSPGNARS
jgi:hypothetical protein